MRALQHAAVVCMLAAIASLPARLSAQEGESGFRPLPVNVTVRLGPVSTPDWAGDCGHSHATLGFEVRSKQRWFVFVARDYLVSMGGTDQLCTRRLPDGSDRIADGPSAGGKRRWSAGVGHVVLVTPFALETAAGVGLSSEGRAERTERALWAGGSLRATALRDKLVLSAEHGAYRHELRPWGGGEPVHGWDRLTAITFGLRL